MHDLLKLSDNGPGIYAVLPKAQLSADAEARKGNIDIYGVLAFRFFIHIKIHKSMTVKQLIKKLEKMPKNLQVYWADHDHGRFETNNIANFVELVDKNEMTEIENDDNCRYSDCYKDTPNKYVVIRP